jgi:hypothetical protein
MDWNFLEPWAAVTSHAANLEAELRREVSEGHPLHGYSPSAVAQRTDSDDVLFRLDRSSKAVFDVTRYQERIFPRFRLHFVAKIFSDCP